MQQWVDSSNSLDKLAVPLSKQFGRGAELPNVADKAMAAEKLMLAVGLLVTVVLVSLILATRRVSHASPK